MLVKPLPPRHVSKDLGNSFLISIPSRKQWAWVFFLVVWLSFWAMTEILMAPPLIRAVVATGLGGPNNLDWFPIVWTAVWTAIGIFSIYVFLWTVAGREIIEINGQAIRIRLAILGLGIAKEYEAQEIRWLQIFPAAEAGGFRMPSGAERSFTWSRGEGRLGFDYDSKKYVRFGIDIDEAEAHQILAEIQQRYPQHKSKS
jgi:hypothetical protein